MDLEALTKAKSGATFPLGSSANEAGELQDYIAIKTAKGFEVYSGPSKDGTDSKEAHFESIKKNGAKVPNVEIVQQFVTDPELLDKLVYGQP